jgi:hypothetical protein
MWHWQVRGLTDMLAFLSEHGPDAQIPLLPLPWHMDKSGTWFAEITGGYTRDLDNAAQPIPARAVLDAYAAAAGATVEENTALESEAGKRNLVVLGDIGQREPDLGYPGGRTTFVINAEVDDEPGPAGE